MTPSSRADTCDPEILFHDVFRSIPGPQYPKLNLESYTQDPQLDAYREIRNALNVCFHSICSHFTTSIGEPQIHCDIFDSSEIGAFAFTGQGWSFIGVTRGYFLKVNPWIDALAQGQHCQSWMGITPQQEYVAITLLLRRAIEFVVLHELGHHVHGHLDSTCSSIRSEFVTTPAGKNKLNDQACEIDADTYALDRLISRLDSAEAWTASAETGNQSLTIPPAIRIRLLLLAITSFFSIVDDQMLPHKEIITRIHPPAIVRLDFLIGHAMKVLDGRPSVASLEASKVLELFNGVVSSRPKDKSSSMLKQQADALTSEEWGEYYQDLQKARQASRLRYKSRQWIHNDGQT